MVWAWANIASAADLWQKSPLKKESKRTLGRENSSLESEATNYMPADDYYTEQINQSQTTTNTQAGEDISVAYMDSPLPVIQESLLSGGSPGGMDSPPPAIPGGPNTEIPPTNSSLPGGSGTGGSSPAEKAL